MGEATDNMKADMERNGASTSIAQPSSTHLPTNGRGVWHYFTAPYAATKGVETWKCWSFWIVLACYIASFLVIAHDPFFYDRFHFRLRCIFPFLIAFFLLASLNWELLLTGAPRGANLLLHILMLPSSTLLFTRILLATDKPTIEGNSPWIVFLENLVKPITELAKVLTEKLPMILKDTFSHPWLALFLILLLAILSLRNHYAKISAVFCILATLLGGLFTSGGNLYYSIVALLLFGVGFCLQWNPYLKLAYHINVCNRMMKMRKPEDGRFVEVVLTVMDKLYKSSTMDSHRFSHITKEVYAPNGNEFTENDIKLISGEISRRMVEDLELVSIEMTGNTITLSPLPQLFHCNKILENSSSFARLGAVAGIAILWTVMPFDFIPDFVPCIGILDDLIVNAMTVFICRNCVKQLPKKLE